MEEAQLCALVGEVQMTVSSGNFLGYRFGSNRDHRWPRHSLLSPLVDRSSCYSAGLYSEKRRAMRATRSRTITSLLTAVGAGLAVSAMIGAPAAVAQPGDTACEPGQVVIDGQCNVPDVNANNLPAPGMGGGMPGMGGGGPGMGGGDYGGGHR